MSMCSAERRYETYEISFAAKAGLAVAVDYTLQIGVSRIWDRVWFLAEALRAKLRQIEAVEVHDRGRLKCGIVGFTMVRLTPAIVSCALLFGRCSYFSKSVGDFISLVRYLVRIDNV